VIKSFISEIKEEEGWGQIDMLGEEYEREEEEGEGYEERREGYGAQQDEYAGRDETLSEGGRMSMSELTELDHESEGNELD
jgi:hypothetical protein